MALGYFTMSESEEAKLLNVHGFTKLCLFMLTNLQSFQNNCKFSICYFRTK